MNKINYPTGDKLKIFLSKYKNIFNMELMQAKLENALDNKKFHVIKGVAVSDILTCDLTELIEINQKFNSCKPTEKERDSIKKIFNYDSNFKNPYEKYQRKIAKFFIEHKEILKIKTCFFCNLDNISAFVDASDYVNTMELLKYGSKEDLTAIRGVGEKTAEKILSCQKELFPMSKLEEIIKKLEDTSVRRNQIESLKNMEFDSHSYYFTLDHVLDKGKNPFSSLSIFNLVPSCYACNSKFKTKKVLIHNRTDEFLSPTSNNFSFSKDNSFKIYFSSAITSITNIETIDSFAIRLEPNVKKIQYDRYSKIFKLNARYKEFKEEALELISKGRRYTPDKLESMSDMLGIKVDEVKENVFGKQINNTNMSELPKSKFLSDIAKQVNIK